jgi:ATP adenylyltransferase
MPNPRFRNIITGACPAPLYDTVLWDLGDVVVTPTLGSIIPYWLLVIPRRRAMNMAEWMQSSGNTLKPYINAVASQSARSVDDLIWFEHGTVTENSITGCGVDHAHVHLLLEPPFRFELFQDAVQSATPWLEWQRGTGDPYNLITPSTSYLVAGRGHHFLLSNGVESAGSQYFRRIIAALVGRPESWNYKTHPHLHNVEMTVASARRAI